VAGGRGGAMAVDARAGRRPAVRAPGVAARRLPDGRRLRSAERGGHVVLRQRRDLFAPAGAGVRGVRVRCRSAAAERRHRPRGGGDAGGTVWRKAMKWNMRTRRLAALFWILLFVVYSVAA